MSTQEVDLDKINELLKKPIYSINGPETKIAPLTKQNLSLLKKGKASKRVSAKANNASGTKRKSVSKKPEIVDKAKSANTIKKFLKSKVKTASKKPKITDEAKSVASNTIKNFFKSRLKSKKTKATVRKTRTDDETRSEASDTIKKFFKSKKKKITARFLKHICSDSGMCLAFDAENRKKINKHFNSFLNLKYMTGSIQQIGETSANGFIKEIQYSHDNYTASTVLKSSVKSRSDNLVYEYLVGQFANYQSNFFPCFIETYGLYFYKDDRQWDYFRSTKTIQSERFQQALDNQPISGVDFAKACKKSKHAAILVQYIHGAQLLNSFISADSLNYVSYQMMYQLPYLLYQVYLPLSQLDGQFTHYDLHANNVMVYEPVKGKYIEYVYHLRNGEVIRFKTPYLVKIIDYGRCFFKWKTGSKSNISSPDIYKLLCNERECDYTQTDKFGHKSTYKCGREYGFGLLDNPDEKTSQRCYISSSRNNVSHDLRLLNIVKKVLTAKKAHKYNIDHRHENEVMASHLVRSVLDKVVYGVGTDSDNARYGTVENIVSGLPDKINNVSDAEIALRELIKNPNLKGLNEFKYSDESKKLGTLNIYINGTQMSFVPVK